MTDPIPQAVDLLLGDPAGNSGPERDLWHAKNEALAMILGNLVDWEAVHPYYPAPGTPGASAPVDWELWQRIDKHCGWTLP